MGRFDDKVALVTGGGSGIGRSTALAFAREGARVMVAGRRAAEGQETVRQIEAAGGTATFMQADVSKAADVQALIKATVATYGGLDYAFNNAGIEGGLGPIAQLDEEDYDRTLDTNLKGTWLALRAEIPAMLEYGGGSIVNIASIAGVIGLPGATIYAASKAGVIGLTKAAAMEYAKAGVRVNVVVPGAVDTGMLDRFVGGDQAAKAGITASHPLGRAGRPEEIAAAVLWLCSAEASFVTGAELDVDGGYLAQ